MKTVILNVCNIDVSSPDSNDIQYHTIITHNRGLCFLCIIQSSWPQTFIKSFTCQGGRRETRQDGQYCCFDKEETICTKIIKGPMLSGAAPVALLDEAATAAGDEMKAFESAVARAQYFRSCPFGYAPYFGQCCAMRFGRLYCIRFDLMRDEDDAGALDEEVRQAIPMTCNASYPAKVGRWCCTQVNLPRNCVAWKQGDESDTVSADEFDIARQATSIIPCNATYPYRVQDRWCCNNKTLPRICAAYKRSDEAAASDAADPPLNGSCPLGFPDREGGWCCNRLNPRRCNWVINTTATINPQKSDEDIAADELLMNEEYNDDLLDIVRQAATGRWPGAKPAPGPPSQPSVPAPQTPEAPEPVAPRPVVPRPAVPRPVVPRPVVPRPVEPRPVNNVPEQPKTCPPNYPYRRGRRCCRRRRWPRRCIYWFFTDEDDLLDEDDFADEFADAMN